MFYLYVNEKFFSNFVFYYGFSYMGNYMVSDEINCWNNFFDICYGYLIYVGCVCINFNISID